MFSAPSQTYKPFWCERTRRFEAVRYTILERLSGGVKDVLTVYDKKTEAQLISSKFQSALVQTAVLEAGAAVTVGGLVAAQALDLSGILAASTIAVLGLFVLPYRRRAQRAEFRAKVDKLKEQIDEVLAQHLEREMTKIRDRILDNISPYTRYEKIQQHTAVFRVLTKFLSFRFVRSEDEKVVNTTKMMKEVQNELRAIKDAVQ